MALSKVRPHVFKMLRRLVVVLSMAVMEIGALEEMFQVMHKWNDAAHACDHVLDITVERTTINFTTGKIS